MLKAVEIYEENVSIPTEQPDGSRSTSFQKRVLSRPILVNRDYVVSARSYDLPDGMLSRAEQGLPEGSKFSKIVLDGNTFGASETIILESFDSLSRRLQGK